MTRHLYKFIACFVFFTVAAVSFAAVTRTSDSASFASLTAALADAGTLDGDTLQLDADQVENDVAVTKAVTIDLNGHTLSAASGVNLLNVNTNIAVTLQNGTINGANLTGAGVLVNGAQLTANGLTVSGCVAPSFFLIDSAATGHGSMALTNVTIDGTGFTSMVYDTKSIWGLVSMAKNANLTLTMNGCTLNGAGGPSSLIGVYATTTAASIGAATLSNGMVNANVSITGCAFNGIKSEAVDHTGVYGSLSVVNSTFTNNKQSINVKGMATAETVSNCTFTGSTDSPMAYNPVKDPTGSVLSVGNITGCTFNAGPYSLIKLNAPKGTVNVTNCTFDHILNNASNDPRAAIWPRTSDITVNVTGCTFTGTECGVLAKNSDVATTSGAITMTNCTMIGGYYAVRTLSGNFAVTLNKCIFADPNTSGLVGTPSVIQDEDTRATPVFPGGVTTLPIAITNSVYVNVSATNPYDALTTSAGPVETNVVKTAKDLVAFDPASVFFDITSTDPNYLTLNGNGPAVNIDGAAHNAGSKAVGGSITPALVLRTGDSVQFSTLAAALADAGTVGGSTLQLIDNDVENDVAVTKAVTIDLNGKTLSCASGVNMLSVAGDVAVTLMNGTINGTHLTGVGVRVNGSQLTVNGLSVAGFVAPSFFLTDTILTGHASMGLTNVTIDGTAATPGVFIYNTKPIAGLVGMAESANLTLSLTGCTMTGTVGQTTLVGVQGTLTSTTNLTATAANGMYNSTLSISGCTFNTIRNVAILHQGIYGSVSVTNSTFTNNKQSINATGMATAYTVTNCSFTASTDTALAANVGKDTFNSSTVANVANVSGCTFGPGTAGAFKCNMPKGTVNVTNCTFDRIVGNSSNDARPGIWPRTSEITVNVTGCTFTGTECGVLAKNSDVNTTSGVVNMTNCTMQGGYEFARLLSGNFAVHLDKCIFSDPNTFGIVGAPSVIQDEDTRATPVFPGGVTTLPITITNSVYVNVSASNPYDALTTSAGPVETNVVKTAKDLVAGDWQSVFFDITSTDPNYLTLNGNGPAVNIAGAGLNAGSKAVGGTIVHTYNLTYTAGANGTVNGGAVVNATVNAGDSGPQVTAAAAAHYSFVNWTDALTNNPRTDSNVNADITVTANFTIDTFTLHYAAVGHGSITGAATQNNVPYGSDGTQVTAQADSGYHFVQWSDTLGTASRTDNATGNLDVTASFAADAPKLVERTSDSAQFDSLSAALADGSTVDGSTLQLLADQAVSDVAVTKAVTIDLNGKTLSSAAGVNLLNINGNHAVTVRNGSINGANLTGPGVLVNGAQVTATDLGVTGCKVPSFFLIDAALTGHGALSLTNVNIGAAAGFTGMAYNGKTVGGLVTMAENANLSLTMNGCTFSGATGPAGVYGVMATLTSSNLASATAANGMLNSTMSITGCTFDTIKTPGVAILHTGLYGSVSVTGSTFTGNHQCLNVMGLATAETVTNCTFTGGDDSPMNYAVTRDPLNVTACSTTISGCTFGIGAFNKIKCNAPNGSVNVTNCKFDQVTANAANDPRAAIYARTSFMTVNVTSCTFTGTDCGVLAKSGDVATTSGVVNMTNCTMFGGYYAARLLSGNFAVHLNKCIFADPASGAVGTPSVVQDEALPATALYPSGVTELPITITNSVYVNVSASNPYDALTTDANPVETNVIKTAKDWIADDKGSVFASINPLATAHFLTLNAYGPAVNIDGAGHFAGSKPIGGNVPVELSVFSVE